MAEQELIKHAEEAIKILGNKKISFWHKLKDFVLEIAVIVFAISLSIWFHNWSEYRNEQKTVKTFLLGLKVDLKSDIIFAKDALHNYQYFGKIYTYLSGLDKNKTPDKDSLKMALTDIRYKIFLEAHTSRFNGFLSAGKIMTIENDSLAQDILNYYQDILPNLKISENWWHSTNESLQTYLSNNIKDFDDNMDEFHVLATSRGKHITKSLIPSQQLLFYYQAVIDKGNNIITTINKLYPNNK
jgi:hypothetical protein